MADWERQAEQLERLIEAQAAHVRAVEAELERTKKAAVQLRQERNDAYLALDELRKRHGDDPFDTELIDEAVPNLEAPLSPEDSDG